MKSSYVRAVLLCAAFVGLLLIRVGFLFHTEAQENLTQFVGTTSLVTGTVADDVDARVSSVRVTLNVSTVNGKPANGKLIAVLPLSTNVSYGDILTIKGKPELPPNFITDTGREFDYVNYLRLSGVSVLIEHATLAHSTTGGASMWRGLYALKHDFENSLASMFPPQDAALMQGILLGERHGLSPQLESGLVAAGLIHIVILAGYVLSLIADILTRTAEKVFSKRIAALIVAIVLILFVIMTGAASTTVRASIMALVALTARILNRPSVAMRALIFAAAVMILWNPLIVLYDESFLISVVATFGLVACGNWAQEKLQYIPEKFELRGIASSSLTVTVFAMPAILYYTGTISLISVPANLIVLPFLPWLMLAGWLSVWLALIPTIGQIFALVPAFIAHVLLRGLLFIVSLAQTIPFASVIAPPFAAWIAIAVYVPLILAASYLVLKNDPQSQTS